MRRSSCPYRPAPYRTAATAAGHVSPAGPLGRAASPRATPCREAGAYRRPKASSGLTAARPPSRARGCPVAPARLAPRRRRDEPPTQYAADSSARDGLTTARPGSRHGARNPAGAVREAGPAGLPPSRADDRCRPLPLAAGHRVQRRGRRECCGSPSGPRWRATEERDQGLGRVNLGAGVGARERQGGLEVEAAERGHAATRPHIWGGTATAAPLEPETLTEAPTTQPPSAKSESGIAFPPPGLVAKAESQPRNQIC